MYEEHLSIQYNTPSIVLFAKFSQSLFAQSLSSPIDAEAMCQEIAKEGNGIYVRVDNSNSAQKAINQEINKMAKSDVESKVYTDYNEQFQVIAWMILLLLLVEMLILDRKNPLFKNIRLFSNK
jgi:Ca-activated chloride channel homolog